MLSSSGITKKIADFSLQNFSISTVVSKHNICSISESINAFKRDKTVERTDIIACSPVFKAAPANHFALWLSGK